jgi:cob(I)alamin adenosyltransferase
MLEKGLVQIYTGDGKGKTTAAFGLALRAAGQGNRVLIYQFLKPASLDIGERFALQAGAKSYHGHLGRGSTGWKPVIQVEALDIEWDMAKSFEDEKQVVKTKAAISEAIERLAQTAEKKFYDVLILDEIVFCLSKGLAKLEDIKNLIKRKNPAVEIVMTGRGATKELIELADLVTEMKNIKHPFDKGIKARKGIEF